MNIPGSTSGIGLALAVELQARGNTVIVGGRRADLLERIAAEHPGLNVLVTMAGIMHVEDWHQPESFLASAESVVTTNVLGPIRLIATIITVSSGLAFTPLKVTPSSPAPA
jgi:uncharacterized oxidoreductase